MSDELGYLLKKPPLTAERAAELIAEHQAKIAEGVRQVLEEELLIILAEAKGTP